MLILWLECSLCVTYALAMCHVLLCHVLCTTWSLTPLICTSVCVQIWGSEQGCSHASVCQMSTCNLDSVPAGPKNSHCTCTQDEISLQLSFLNQYTPTETFNHILLMTQGPMKEVLELYETRLWLKTLGAAYFINFFGTGMRCGDGAVHPDTWYVYF